ncbi:MAG: hypothetical protein JNJ54_22915 [Myxococcaceae bacterium]|nr:hypothetical protein [Myxococcaceae bacterium]
MAKVIPVPREFRPSEVMAPLVLAADTPTVRAACDVLFIAGPDLAWDEQALGHFLVDGPFDPDLRETLELAAAGAEFSFTRLIGSMWPVVKPLLGAAVAEAQEGRRRNKKWGEAEGIATVVGAVTRGTMGQPDALGVLPLLANLLPQGMGWLASRLAVGAMALRERELAATGLSPARYVAMVQALVRIGAVHPLVRVARPPGNNAAEVTLASPSGLFGSTPTPGTRSLDVLRLDPALSALRAGEDRALPLFIAEFINHRLLGSPAAFACARYGNSDAPEFDVLVPEAKVGVEVKLFQGSNAKLVENLKAAAKKLAEKQLPAYRDLGCKKVLLVTNLDEGRAEAFLGEVRKMNPKLARLPIVLVGGVERLAAELREVVKTVSAPRNRAASRELQGLADEARRGSKRRSARGPVGARDPSPGLSPTQTRADA